MIDTKSVLIGVLIGVFVNTISFWLRTQRENSFIIANKFIFPYITLYNKNHKGAAFDFHDLDANQQTLIIDLISENLVHVKYYPKIFDVMYELITSYNDSSLVEEANVIYRQLNRIMFEEGNKVQLKNLPFYKKYFLLESNFKIIDNKYSFMIINIKTDLYLKRYYRNV